MDELNKRNPRELDLRTAMEDARTRFTTIHNCNVEQAITMIMDGALGGHTPELASQCSVSAQPCETGIVTRLFFRPNESPEWPHFIGMFIAGTSVEDNKIISAITNLRIFPYAKA